MTTELRATAASIAASLPPDAVAIHDKPASEATSEDYARHSEAFDPAYAFLAVIAEADSKALRRAARRARGEAQHLAAALLSGAALRIEYPRTRD